MSPVTLHWLGTHGFATPNPQATRRQDSFLLRELMAIPQPNDIAIPAGWIVERAEGGRTAPALRPIGG